MENPYICRFEMDHRGDVKIKLNGDGQEIEFKFMIAWLSVPSFFFILLQLWNGKTKKTEIDGFGFAFLYKFTIRENSLYIEYLTTDDDGQIISSNFKFDYKKFVKAIDKGFSDYIDEQYSLPLNFGEAIEAYNQFSAIIRNNLNQ